ncbi:hypothetical protein HK103_002566 [Boothiomyces macroporosus]|uniref:LITAF domain-containing protein n=1 Tax=Boothiomyces macroporosus TaxID=261099 RepID=A0AAD5UD53_9FUNG|nr:hypothetical protein HK103_002566 [Boothiomyces macroporosus]
MEKTNQQAPTYPPQYQQTPGQPQPPQAQYVVQQSTPITSAPGPQAPMYVAPAVFGEFPQPITCINCKQQGVSMTEKVMGAAGWVAVFGTCLVCCCLAWVPCVIDTCKDTNHRCSNCGMLVGTKKMI